MPKDFCSATPLEVSLEMSKTSVVRVCANRDQYVSYGGPPSSAGFWNSATEELVLFDEWSYVVASSVEAVRES